MDTLLLFDIDGTLLTTGKAGEKALKISFKKAFGCEEDFAKVEIAGRTDSGIARQLFTLHNIELNSENLALFFESYLEQLALQLPASTGRLLPGIPELLRALKANQRVALGLLTGNLAKGAELKLTHYGVWHFFEFGAFADDHHVRNELGAFARARAFDRHNVEFQPERIFVLGDTPHDIECGRAIGARTVAVATGNYTCEQLAAFNPDFLFEDFSQTHELLAAFGL